MRLITIRGLWALTVFSFLLAGCAGQAASPTPVVPPTAAGPIIVTKAPITLPPTETPQPTVGTPSPTAFQLDNTQAAVSGTLQRIPTSQGTAPAVSMELTAGPTVTSSGPTLAAVVKNSQSFNDAAPTTVGPFKRIKGESSTDAHGSVINYRTDEGAVYEVVLWITDSAQDALTRYQVETGTVSDKRPLKVGDEGVITGQGNYVLAEVRYRNMVLIIHRPNAKGTVPTHIPTEQEVIALVTSLFNTIPKS